jgi:hypothetical protein
MRAQKSGFYFNSPCPAATFSDGEDSMFLVMEIRNGIKPNQGFQGSPVWRS